MLRAAAGAGIKRPHSATLRRVPRRCHSLLYDYSARADVSPEMAQLAGFAMVGGNGKPNVVPIAVAGRVGKRTRASIVVISTIAEMSKINRIE